MTEPVLSIIVAVAWESLPGLLPGRRHIVLSRDPGYRAVGAEVATSLEQALELAGDTQEVMIIGGARLYEQALPLAQRLYLTEIDADIEGDAHFPSFDPALWREVSRERRLADERNEYACCFRVLERIGERG